MPGFRTGHPRCRLLLGTNQALAAGAHPVVWSSVDYDDVSGWDGASGYTLDRDGLWLLHGVASLAAVSPAARATVRWSINGVDQLQSASTSNTTTNQVSTQQILELAAGDLIELIVQRSPTAASSITAIETWAHILRVGPKRWT